MAHSLTIGFAQLTDCAPLAVAKERGAFAAHGLDVTLKRFVSWAAMRDALGTGANPRQNTFDPLDPAEVGSRDPAWSKPLRTTAMSRVVGLYEHTEKNKGLHRQMDQQAHSN